MMINSLGDKEQYDYWREDISLDDHYEVNYLEKDKYEWLFNLLDEQQQT